MRQLFLRKSLQTQLVTVTVACIGLMSVVALAVVTASTWAGGGAERGGAQVLRLRLLAGVGLGALACVGIAHVTFGRLLRPLYRIRDAMWQVSQGSLQPDGTFAVVNPGITPGRDIMGLRHTFTLMLQQLQTTAAAHEQSKISLARRTATVDRLLEFSLNIQGAGKPEQVFGTLCHYLQTELALAGVVILSFEADATPPAQVRSACPSSLLCGSPAATEMETALCPCHRQHLPRHFRNDGSPVRCSLDASLTLGPTHPAYCIPFTLGGKTPGVVHMLLPESVDWTDESKQLAQTYVNTAQSALISLHLLTQAETQSMTDVMTGLFNRRSMEQLLQREVALCERHHTALSIVMIDMDQFKTVNDTHGHAAGDFLLKSFADCVHITLRKTDLAFRYGGDEFVVALPQTNVHQAEQVVQKLRQAFAAVDFSGAIAHLDHHPTLSIGVAERSEAHGVLTLPSLLGAADTALYDAKNANRNCIRIFQPVRAA